jgi:hypothetical protein
LVLELNIQDKTQIYLNSKFHKKIQVIVQTCTEKTIELQFADQDNIRLIKHKIYEMDNIPIDH